MDFKIALFENNISSLNIPYIIIDDAPYFKGKDIATVLGYADTKQAIRVNVDDDDKNNLEELNLQLESLGGVSNTPLDYNEGNTIYINESGLYSLILRSEKQESKMFKKWITSDLLPSIRSTGSYVIPLTKKPQKTVMNETDLHYKVIDFIRTKYPDIIIYPGLGEHQNTSSIRRDAYNKGYRGGQPAITIVNSHKTFNGLALELKHPGGSGRLQPNQQDYLKNLKRQNYKIVISDDYDLILIEPVSYFRDIRIHCPHCVKQFKNSGSLATHLKYFHKFTKSDNIEYNNY